MRCREKLSGGRPRYEYIHCDCQVTYVWSFMLLCGNIIFSKGKLFIARKNTAPHFGKTLSNISRLYEEYNRISYMPYDKDTVAESLSFFVCLFVSESTGSHSREWLTLPVVAITAVLTFRVVHILSCESAMPWNFEENYKLLRRKKLFFHKQNLFVRQVHTVDRSPRWCIRLSSSLVQQVSFVSSSPAECILV